MLVPVIVILVLMALIKATAKKLNVSSTVPLAVSIGMYVVFVLLAKGIIRVDEGQIESVLSGVAIAIGLYVAVAAVIYIQAYIWMKRKSKQQKE